ncbi:50S ribosomal protein L19 [Patescibacteria group bacterium]|nr:50S ribosomal protein L19 [Patescibacteria group bacterium]
MAEETSSNANINTIPDFRAGDTVKVHYKIIEGEKARIQPYEGIVISTQGKDMGKTFTVRRIGAYSVGVERIFPLFSPNIVKIEIKKKGNVRRAKLYYLRDKIGKAASKVKEQRKTS